VIVVALKWLLLLRMVIMRIECVPKFARCDCKRSPVLLPKPSTSGVSEKRRVRGSLPLYMLSLAPLMVVVVMLPRLRVWKSSRAGPQLAWEIQGLMGTGWRSRNFRTS